MRFDLAGRGVRLEDFPSRIGWNHLWDFVSEIMREPSSHLRSAMHGDLYVPDAAERAAWATFEAWLNTQTKKGAGFRKVKRPWTGTKPAYVDLPPELDTERAQRRARLAELF